MKARLLLRLASLGVAIVLASGLGSAWARTGPKTWKVGEHAPTLAATLQLARDGDTVELPPGTWRGGVRITRSITLRGRGGIIDGGGEGNVVVLDAPNVELRNLRIQGSGSDLGHPDCCVYLEPTAAHSVLEGNSLRDCAFGIWVHTTRSVRLERNTIEGRKEVRPTDRGNGIQLFDAGDLVVRENVVRRARDGIYVSATEDSLIEANRTSHLRFGIHYMYSYRNTLRANESRHNKIGYALMESRDLVIHDNIAEHNSRDGLLFRDAQECDIRGNRLAHNGQGLFFYSSTDNRIVANHVVDNDVGAKIWAGSVRNQVSRNVFVGNRQQIFYVGTSDLVWGEESVGNYWSDYLGWDHDGDGIGDRPYRLDSFSAHLLYRFPAAALLLRSPALELLSHLSQSLPILRTPTVIDRAPLARRNL